MMNAQKSILSEPREDEIFAAAAARSIATLVEAGARILAEEPWRVSRILPGADGMTIEELVGQVARRCRAGAPADLNRAIALAQLRVALQSAQFPSVWARWRRQSER
jgi:hypothetical protein